MDAEKIIPGLVGDLRACRKELARLQALGIDCDHEWTGQQLGGPPDMAESTEWVEYCKKCGYERDD